MEEKILNNLREYANDWYDAFNRCCKGQNPHIDEFGRHVTQSPNIPAIVNGAFACELYFRFLPKNDEYTNKHNLLEFYKKLTQKQKSTISCKYSLKAKGYFKINKLKSALNLSKCAFNFWRYSYKKKERLSLLNQTLNTFSMLLPILYDLANS